jgi:hypothetical protein
LLIIATAIFARYFPSRFRILSLIVPLPWKNFKFPKEGRNEASFSATSLPALSMSNELEGKEARRRVAVTERAREFF